RAAHCAVMPDNSAALNVAGANWVLTTSGGLLKNPDGSGSVIQASGPARRTLAPVPTVAALHVSGFPVGAEAPSFTVRARRTGETGGLSVNKFCHTESDARAFGRMRQLQQDTRSPVVPENPYTFAQIWPFWFGKATVEAAPLFVMVIRGSPSWRFVASCTWNGVSVACPKATTAQQHITLTVRIRDFSIQILPFI